MFGVVRQKATKEFFFIFSNGTQGERERGSGRKEEDLTFSRKDFLIYHLINSRIHFRFFLKKKFLYFFLLFFLAMEMVEAVL